ncbi:MAG: hypothetical protein HYU30_04520 [Chloroflexi bacterium]|nr:hypothetical protein [Chloroflexota bacterium]
MKDMSLTDADLDFIVGEAPPGAAGAEHLKGLIRSDGAFRKALVGDDRVFQRVMDDEEVFVKISPGLYFEVLLRRALKELDTATHTVERAGRQSIPVFDTREVVDLLSKSEVLLYLAHMLASFTRVHSYATSVRVRRGIRRRVRFSDMDIDSLLRVSATVEEEQRFGFYKRIADVCLFVSGVFPDYPFYDYRYPGSGQVRPLTRGRLRRSLEEYERDGRRFYGLAQRHPTAHVLELAGVFRLLGEHFTSARKPLAFIAAHYLHSQKQRLFVAPTQPA